MKKKEKINEDEVFTKEINQLDTIEKNTHTAVKQMGQIWKACGDKLETDGVCFMCKGKLKQEEGKPLFHVIRIPDIKIDKGIFALAAVCNDCNK